MTDKPETLAEVCARVMPPPGFSAAQVLAAARKACANEKVWRADAQIKCTRGEGFGEQVKYYILKSAVTARDQLLQKKAPRFDR